LGEHLLGNALDAPPEFPESHGRPGFRENSHNERRPLIGYAAKYFARRAKLRKNAGIGFGIH
jgi:hypothetical protein